MMYPLVRELAEDGIPVTVTCRVLKIARQPYYRRLTAPVTDADLEEAHRANALFDAHKDDPEFGYRFLLDEARDAGVAMADRTAWRICSDNGWWSAFGKKKARGKAKKPGPPVHDDLVQRNFAAEAANQLWLGDITEHPTREGKLYLCAIKDYVRDGFVHGLPFAVLVGHEGLRRTPELAGARHRPTMNKAAFWPGEFAKSFGREVATTVAPAVGIWCDAQFDTDTLLLQTLDPATVEQVVPTALAAFSQAMLPVHLTEGLRGPSFRSPPVPAPDWARALRWLHARGNPWALGPTHLRALRFAGKETIGS